MAFKDNILDLYDLSTYHLKMFMLPERNVNNPPYRSDDGIIIAESGVTGEIFINELSIRSYISLSKHNRNSHAVNFDLVLREFSGASFLDKIFAASLSLGIQNYFKSPYFIELTFKGRDPTTGESVTLPNQRWVWPFIIQKVVTGVDEGGSTYTITAFHLDQLGQKEPHIMVDKSIQFKNVKTVKEATDQLQKELTKRGKEKAITTYSLPDKYTITYPIPEINNETSQNQIANMKITSEKTTDSTKQSTSGEKGKNESDNTAKNVPVESDKNIIDVLNNIIVSAEEYQKMCKNSESATDQGDEGNKPKVFHKIVTKTKQLSYDITRGDYQREYIFEIHPYEMGTVQSSPKETINSNSKIIFKNRQNQGLIEKRYNYLFTGENDQVLNFDMSFNMGWFANMPSQGGLDVQSWGSSSEGQHFTLAIQKYKELHREIKTTISNAPDKPNAQIRNTQKLSKKISDSELPDDQKATLQNLLRTQSRSRLDEDGQKKYNERLQERESSGSKSTTSMKSRFVSDYRLDQALKEADVQTKFRLIPPSYLESSVKNENNMQANVEGSKSGGREYVNSLFQQVFETGTSGDLVNIEIEVKGDPYWLGPSNSLEPIPQSGAAAQVYILFTVKTPMIPNVATGVINSRPTALNGLYGIKHVENKFSDGKFTQVLHGVREPLVNVSELGDDTI